MKESARTHQWYFFTKNGFEKTSLPQRSGISSLKPWTETLRCSDSGIDSKGLGCLVVNRLGIILLGEDGVPVLMQDMELFSDTTASSLIFDNGNPYITLSRSSFFNKEAALDVNKSEENPDRPYLVRCDFENRAFFPVVTYGDLKLASGGEITGTRFDGKNFLISAKYMDHSKTYFNYYKFNSLDDLKAMSPFTQEGKIIMTETTEAAYRKENSPARYSEAPKRVKNLLKSIPSTFDFVIECKNAGGVSPRYFTTTLDADGLTHASTIISDGWICAVFSDGTTYFNGALEGRHIVNSGKNMAFRLPKLPEGYVYSSFCISGNKMAVSWEESDFYKTGRSGFLVVDLGKVLYGDL